jgi:hypothetical protein
MGLWAGFDWLVGKNPLPPPVSVKPDPRAKPFGVDKPIGECSDKDIQASREALYEAASVAGAGIGWEYNCQCNHQSTLLELAVDGWRVRYRKDLPPIPRYLRYQCEALRITRAELELREEDGPPRLSVAYLALTREELEGFCDAVYSKKTTKAQTKGRCYFCGFRHNVPSKPGQSGAAHFLQHTNALTRQVVLGEELAADFEQRTGRNGITAQQWIEQVLRPKVLQ